MTHGRALGLLVLTALLWSIGGWLVKSVNLSPLAIAGARSGIAAIVMCLAAGKPRFIWTKAQWGAAISLALCVTFFVTATRLTTAANAILIQYTAPIYVALLSHRLLGERITRRDWMTLFVVMAGMILFFIEKVSPEHMLGNVTAVASGVSFAGIAIFLRMQKGESTIESLILGHAMTALIGLPFLFLGNTPTGHDVTILLVLGVVQLGIPYVLYAIAIRHVTALEAILVPVIEPLLNPVWVAIFIGEKPGRLAMAGGALVVAAVLYHGLTSPKRADGR